MTFSDQPGQQSLRRGRFSQENARYFITICTEKRARILSKSGLPGMIFKCLQEENELWELIASVVMADHIHFIVCLKIPSLSEGMKTFKGRSAAIINISLERKGPVWQSGFFDHKFRDDEDLAPILLYM
jgi:putative transposase